MQEKNKPKWDGRSRPSNNLYKKNYDRIFKKLTDENAEKFVHGENEQESKEDNKQR